MKPTFVMMFISIILLIVTFLLYIGVVTAEYMFAFSIGVFITSLFTCLFVKAQKIYKDNHKK